MWTSAFRNLSCHVLFVALLPCVSKLSFTGRKMDVRTNKTALQNDTLLSTTWTTLVFGEMQSLNLKQLFWTRRKRLEGWRSVSWRAWDTSDAPQWTMLLDSELMFSSHQPARLCFVALVLLDVDRIWFPATRLWQWKEFCWDTRVLTPWLFSPDMSWVVPRVINQNDQIETLYHLFTRVLEVISQMMQWCQAYGCGFFVSGRYSSL